jgi:DedD protein
MAFFKFRFPGQAATSPATAEAVAPGSGESIELVRRRARHRLIGAVVLVLLAVVGFPLMFDTQPRPVAVDTPILIPDRPTNAPLKVNQTPPADANPAQPLLSEAKPLPVQEGLDVKEEVVQSAKPSRAEEPKRAQESLAQPTEVAPKPPEAKAEVKPEVKTAPSKTDNPESVAKPKDDGNKARALLEGKPPSAWSERHVVQVGAFSDPAKVREVRRKLEQAGLSSFIQTVDGKDGKSTTRVRVGPFSSREEAEKAAAKVRKLELSAAVLRI